ncbi:MAG: amino acid adenylation domain-containing protein [Chitinophagaceae bacterium]
MPFEKVVEVLVKERDLSRNPLFQVMFSTQNLQDVSQLHLGEMELSIIKYENLTAQFDIAFNINETPGGMQGAIQYSTDLYNEATILRMMDHFKELLTSIVKSPQQKIGLLPMLTVEEEQQLLYEFNNTKIDYPKYKRIVDLFEEQAAKTPQSVAIVFEKEQLSYKQLNEKANQLAHYLRSRGVKQETLVPICIERSLEMIIGILGILKAGGAYVPIDPEYPQERISYMLKDTDATIVISSKESRLKIQASEGVELIELDSKCAVISESPTSNPETTLDSHNLAYVIYTSGSTGKPKGVMIENGSMVDKLMTESRLLNADHSIITCLTTNYIFDASLLEIFLPLILGGQIAIPTKEVIFSTEELATFLFKNGVTILQGTPSFLQHLLQGLKTDTNKKLGKNLNQLCIGGESLSSALVKEVSEILPHVKLNNHYGPTESTIDAIVFEGVKEFDKNIIGKPIANTEIYIVDRYQKLVSKGIAGEICIGGNVLARGYLNSPELTRNKFIPNPFKSGERLYKTGDQGRWTENGNIEFIGRKDDQVKIRGNRVELGEIEAILNEYKDIEQAVVTVKEIREEKLLQAFLVPKVHQSEFWPSVGEYPVYDEVLYFAMTHDKKRVLKYKNAINQFVKGKSVVEIGTGKDAILARLCVEAGARIVYAIEMGKEAFDQANVLIKELGYEEKIVLIQGDALVVNLPEAVDICVSEIIGTIGGSEGAGVILNDAQRFLKKMV